MARSGGPIGGPLLIVALLSLSPELHSRREMLSQGDQRLCLGVR